VEAALPLALPWTEEELELEFVEGVG